MPLPSYLRKVADDVANVGTDLAGVQTAIDALPGTPLEADLPDIVAIVASLQSAATALSTAVSELIATVNSTRINQ